MTMDRTMRVIGAMSGSSLDGIDVARCAFHQDDGRWHFTVEAALTVPYAEDVRTRLLRAADATALELARLHRDIGRLIGEACLRLPPGRTDLISSHGHTVFHQPGEGLTTQVGCGARIAAITGLPVVCDLRSKDVALGGQGAPLVPLGERLLFPGLHAFVNLGGISNIAVHRGGRSTGHDIGPCNQALDVLAREGGQPYDAGGRMARAGRVDEDLLARLDALDFYRLPPPRSLGREWFDAAMRPLITDARIALADRLRTVTEHCARGVGAALEAAGMDRALITGGGAHNDLLVERIGAWTRTGLVRPEGGLIDHKEALVFALLGLLRYRGEPNVLASVTGAARDSIGGALYLPN